MRQSRGGTASAAWAEWAGNWKLVLSALILYACVSIPSYTIGVFIQPIESDLGWSRSAIVSGITVWSVVNTLMGPVTGRMVDKIGTRKIALVCVCIYGTSIALLAESHAIRWVWWATWMLLAFGSVGLSATVWSKAIAGRFRNGTGLALAVALCGSTLGAAIFPMIANALIKSLDWRHAYMALGGGVLAVGFPILYFFFFDAPAASNPDASAGSSAGPEDRQPEGLSLRRAMLSRSFFQLALATILAVVAITAVFIQFVPILMAGGLQRQSAVQASGLMGMVAVVGRLSSGYALDRLNVALVSAVTFLLPIVSIVMLIHLHGSVPFSLVAAGILGVVLGGEANLIAFLALRHFGLRNFGTIFGTLHSLIALGFGIGPLLASSVYDLRGTYEPLLYGLIPAFFFAAVLFGTLGVVKDRGPGRAGVISEMKSQA
jgi:MFS family permease